MNFRFEVIKKASYKWFASDRILIYLFKISEIVKSYTPTVDGLYIKHIHAKEDTCCQTLWSW